MSVKIYSTGCSTAAELQAFKAWYGEDLAKYLNDNYQETEFFIADPSYIALTREDYDEIV